MAAGQGAGMRERRHQPGAELGWAETWDFDFVAPAFGIGGWASLTLLPNRRRAWYHAFVAGPDRQTVAVVDHEVPLPLSTLEIRTTGLWADHICETPGEHWTIGLEAFGLGLDDAWEMYGAQRGDRVPLGFDLEWEATAPTLDRSATSYEQACEVSGEVLVGDEQLDLVGTGTRRHHWGVPTWWDRSSVAVFGAVDGTAIDVERSLSEPAGGGPTSPGSTLDVAGDERDIESAGGGQIRPLGFPPHDRPSTTVLSIAEDERRWHARPLAVTPVEVEDPEGRRSRMPRALCAAATTTGAPGWIWVRWQAPVVDD